MPRGRSTFAKRQKELTRQQRQLDKAERRNQRKQKTAVLGSVDEPVELSQQAGEQTTRLNLGADDAATEHTSASDYSGE